MSNALLEKLETHRALKDSSPGFHLSDEDVDLLIATLRHAEPIFLAQIGDPTPYDELKVWIDAQVSAGKARGATFFRVSAHPSIENLTLIEGWKEQPADQGEPRWQLTGAR